MVLKKLRGFTIAVSVLALISNGLSACLFHKLSNDTYRSSDSLALYTYFSASISLLGVFGSIRQHAYTLSIFANFFILDTIVSALSRFILLYIFSTFRHHLCDAESANTGPLSLTLPHGTFYAHTFSHVDDVVEATKVDDIDPSSSASYLGSGGWGCSEMMQISIMVGWIGLFTSMLVQIFFAVMVRQYAISLWKTQADYVCLDDGILEEARVDGEVEQSRSRRVSALEKVC